MFRKLSRFLMPVFMIFFLCPSFGTDAVFDSWCLKFNSQSLELGMRLTTDKGHRLADDNREGTKGLRIPNEAVRAILDGTATLERKLVRRENPPRSLWTAVVRISSDDFYYHPPIEDVGPQTYKPFFSESVRSRRGVTEIGEERKNLFLSVVRGHGTVGERNVYEFCRFDLSNVNDSYYGGYVELEFDSHVSWSFSSNDRINTSNEMVKGKICFSFKLDEPTQPADLVGTVSAATGNDILDTAGPAEVCAVAVEPTLPAGQNGTAVEETGGGAVAPSGTIEAVEVAAEPSLPAELVGTASTAIGNDTLDTARPAEVGAVAVEPTQPAGQNGTTVEETGRGKTAPDRGTGSESGKGVAKQGMPLARLLPGGALLNGQWWGAR